MNDEHHIKYLLMEGRDHYVKSLNTTSAKNFSASEKKLQEALATIGKTGSMVDIIEAERNVLAFNLAYYSNSPGMTQSLNLAIHSADLTLEYMKYVQDPGVYKSVDEHHGLPKNRKRGVPFDEARDFFRSQDARLRNLET